MRVAIFLAALISWVSGQECEKGAVLLKVTIEVVNSCIPTTTTTTTTTSTTTGVSYFCLGQTCGGCDCCMGGCLLGVCVGFCTQSQSQSIDEACLMAAIELSNGKEICSADCADQGGSQACQSCLVAKNHEACSNTSLKPCWKCAKAVFDAAKKCKKENTIHGKTDWKKVLECAFESVPKSCLYCVCKIVCKVFKSVCSLCEN